MHDQILKGSSYMTDAIFLIILSAAAIFVHNFGIFPHLAIFENTFYLKTGSDFATEN